MANNFQPIISTDLIVQTKTANYTALVTDGLILCSTNPFTVTLPSAVGISGIKIRIQKTDASFTNVITISGTGITTTTLNTIGEQLTVISDGTNWQSSRVYPQITTAYTPTFAGLGTVSTQTTTWQRIGDSVLIRTMFTSGTSTGTTAGVSLPSGLTIATLSASTNTVVGNACRNVATATYYLALAASGGTQILFGNHNGTSIGTTAQAGNVIVNAGDVMTFSAIVPISGWNA